MRTTIHNHLRGQNGCLGFYYGLASLLSAYPEGGLPGEFFINGEKIKFNRSAACSIRAGEETSSSESPYGSFLK